MKNVTRAAVNNEIKKLGFDAELVKGEGYFYFIGSDVECDCDGVYVYMINELTFEEWIEELRSRIVK